MASRDPDVDAAGEMRYLTAVLRPVERIHPVEAALAETPDITPVAIYQPKLLEDDTCVNLLEVRGDLASLDDLLANHTSVLDYALAGDREDFVYIHSESHELGRALLGVQRDADLVVQQPLRHTDDGGLRGTLVGTDAAFQRVAEALPAAIDLEIERTGAYTPDTRQLFASLTDRQREILRAAVEAGYYADPREATQRDLAAQLDIAPGTVSQHLRRIETKVFAEFVGVGD
jgi:DNA-binding CsgD family transcriptional regulator